MDGPCAVPLETHQGDELSVDLAQPEASNVGDIVVVHCAVFDSTMQRANPALRWGSVLGAGLIGRTVDTVV